MWLVGLNLCPRQAVKTRSPNHWAVREFPIDFFFRSSFSFTEKLSITYRFPILPLSFSLPLFPVVLISWISVVHLYYWWTNIDILLFSKGFPGGSDGKEFACNAEDLGLLPGLGRSSGGGHDNPLQCSSLENPHEQRSLVGSSPWGSTKHRTAQHMVPGNHHHLQQVLVGRQACTIVVKHNYFLRGCGWLWPLSLFSTSSHGDSGQKWK